MEVGGTCGKARRWHANRGTTTRDLHSRARTHTAVHETALKLGILRSEPVSLASHDTNKHTHTQTHTYTHTRTHLVAVGNRGEVEERLVTMACPVWLALQCAPARGVKQRARARATTRATTHVGAGVAVLLAHRVVPALPEVALAHAAHERERERERETKHGDYSRGTPLPARPPARAAQRRHIGRRGCVGEARRRTWAPSCRARRRCSRRTCRR
jgi:hypothetical protein